MIDEEGSKIYTERIRRRVCLKTEMEKLKRR